MIDWLKTQAPGEAHPNWVYVLIWGVVFPLFALSLVLMAVFLG